MKETTREGGALPARPRRARRVRTHTCAHVHILAHTYLRTRTCAHILAHLRTHNDLRTHVRGESSFVTASEDARQLGEENKIREEVDLEGAFNAAEGGNRGVEMYDATQRI